MNMPCQDNLRLDQAEAKLSIKLLEDCNLRLDQAEAKYSLILLLSKLILKEEINWGQSTWLNYHELLMWTTKKHS